ncbi:hypothetical protein ACQ86N_42055 [Puia sp. P3]|uniref:hypothetical protein n=1 Tax=Puia sp. P3 TaxID=3423952 RepID=UPI003D67E2DC
MLYDNALLVIVLCEAFQATGRQLYRTAIEETIAFVARDLSNGEGGFYSALDADSEGIEGKYYAWERKEIEEVLGDAAELFCEIYGVTVDGNWEEKNILTRKERPLTGQEKALLEDAKKKLPRPPRRKDPASPRRQDPPLAGTR